jgi:DNA-binding CsgD family transcriptional regulator
VPALPSARYEALLDLLLEAAAVEGDNPFPEPVLALLRRAIPSDAVSYREWTIEGVTEMAFAADNPREWLRVWPVYPWVRDDDPLPGGPAFGAEGTLPAPRVLGRPLTIGDFLSDRDFRNRGLYIEICKPLGVRAVMKLFLPQGASRGSAFVFDTTSSRFACTDRATLQRLIPHLIQLQRNAAARRTYLESTGNEDAPESARLRRLTRREWVVLTRAAAGETNAQVAAALYIGESTVRKHLEHIYEKLDVANRAAAAAAYARAGPMHGVSPHTPTDESEPTP